MKIAIKILLIYLLINNNIFTYSQAVEKNNWQTEFEKSEFLSTESYKNTMQYFRNLADSSKFAKFISLGKSPQQRDIYCLVVSKDKMFSPDKFYLSNKPIVLVVNGIHSGEIEGKDASMILLREILITKEKESLIDNVNLLVIPIFSVDAHERFGRFNRINQNGPVEMGWRTTAQNLNLNRDWMKADAKEMQLLLKFYADWLPDFLIDTHTTDGADYQYTISYGMEKFQNIYSETRNWIKNDFIPFITGKVESAGYLIAPYLSFKNGIVDSGIVDWAATPRFSQGYAAVQNRPGLLVETHMLKPYKDRVFATLAILEATIEYINSHGQELIKLNARADSMSIVRFSNENNYLPVAYKQSDKHSTFVYKGIKSVTDSSEISGTTRITYTGEKYEKTLLYFNDIRVIDSVKVPKAYIIPKQWGDWENIIDRIKLHGIKVEKFKNDTTLIVTKYKFINPKFSPFPYESRQTVNARYVEFTDTVNISSGDYLINTKQRTIRVIANLLEPKSSDSFLRWGFFNQIFERKEYFEFYVMEKLAEEMINKYPKLRDEFFEKINSDEKFRESPYERLNFFYERSPYYDNHLNVYPILKLN